MNGGMTSPDKQNSKYRRFGKKRKLVFYMSEANYVKALTFSFCCCERNIYKYDLLFYYPLCYFLLVSTTPL